MPDRRAPPLIAAKQTIPPTRPGAVPRARLYGPLLATASTRLTVVVAPAGWGKTTLLSQWAHHPAETRRVVWVSLDEADDEPVRFWSYVLAALRRDVAGLSGAPLAALSTPGLQPVDLALPTLLNELSALDTEHVLVLDDYHLLRHPGIHESVEFLLSYLPGTLRLVLAARSDPPLPLARLRARGELTELRAAELGFTAEEATPLLDAVGGVTLDAASAAALCERTEGWAAGLQLAALTLRGTTGSAAAEMIRGDHRHVLDYLSAEVIDRLPPDHRDFLVRTSVLERLSGPLCDDVLDRTGSAAVLAELDHADVFVVPLDSRREWYRCHQLFREVLLREAGDPGGADRVLARAADWYLARDHVAEAVEHRIRSGDHEGAAELLRSRVTWFLERGAAGTYQQLAQLLPPPVLLGDPTLCVSLAWAAGFSGQYVRMGTWLDAAEPLITDVSRPMPGWLTLRGAAETVRAREHGTVHADLERALPAGMQAVELETDPAMLGYVLSRTVLGGILIDADRPDDAIAFLEDAWHRARLLGLSPLLALQAASALALGLFETGRVDRLRRLLADVAPEVHASEQHWGVPAGPGVTRLWTVEGRLARHDGDLAAAALRLRRAVELARSFGEASALVTALTQLAHVEIDRHDPTAARAALAEARELAETEPVLPLAQHRLATAERRAGRGPARLARPAGVLVEELTDRERAVLRALTGEATQREIGAALYLSINTVKGYTKILYRKLGVATRQDAVRQARALGLI